jgi:hypothetical protein
VGGSGANFDVASITLKNTLKQILPGERQNNNQSTEIMVQTCLFLVYFKTLLSRGAIISFVHSNDLVFN